MAWDGDYGNYNCDNYIFWGYFCVASVGTRHNSGTWGFIGNIMDGIFATILCLGGISLLILIVTWIIWGFEYP